MDTTPPHPIESKVKTPSLVALALAILALASAFGLDVSQEQQNAILGLVTAGLPVVVFVAGYLAKHTERPDLEAHGEHPDAYPTQP